MEIEDFIRAFKIIFDRNYGYIYPKASYVFKNGECYNFACLLQRFYKEGFLLVDTESNKNPTHCAFQYKGEAYDINGLNSDIFYPATLGDIQYMKRCFKYAKSIESKLESMRQNDLEIPFILGAVLKEKISLRENLLFLEQYRQILLKTYGKRVDIGRVEVSKKMSAFLMTFLNQKGLYKMEEGIEGAQIMAISSVFQKQNHTFEEILFLQKYVDTLSLRTSLLGMIKEGCNAQLLEKRMLTFYEDLYLRKKEILKVKKSHEYSLKLPINS